MGKLNEKRKRNRQEYLRGLAMKNPAKFQREWSERLSNYMIDAARRLTALPDSQFKENSKAFDIVSEAVSELNRISARAVEIDSLAECCTEKLLNSSCEYIVALWADLPFRRRLP